MDKQRFHTQMHAKTFVFKHVVDAEFHLTPDEFRHKFGRSAPDEMFDLMCVCDDESNALELCRAANRADVLDSARWTMEAPVEIFTDHPPVDISRSGIGALIGARALVKIKPVRLPVLDMMPPLPSDALSALLDPQTVTNEPVTLCCDDFPFCGHDATKEPSSEPELEVCKGCDIPFCSCWDGKPDPNAAPDPSPAPVPVVDTELPCMGLANGCVCDNCAPF